MAMTQHHLDEALFAKLAELVLGLGDAIAVGDKDVAGLEGDRAFVIDQVIEQANNGTAAIEPAWRTAIGVSTIAQRRMRSGAPASRNSRAICMIEPGPSIFFRDMAGSRIPVVTAHGEGRAELDPSQLAAIERAGLIAARFVDGRGAVATRYPDNPNGSPGGIAALTNATGRITILMPHPERVVDPLLGGTDGRALFESLIEALS